MTVESFIRRIEVDRYAVWSVFGLALLVRLILLFFLHSSYYTSGMAQGELARNLVEGRGFVQNIPFAQQVGTAQWEESRLIDLNEAVERFNPPDAAGDFRPFIAYMMPGQAILLAVTYKLTGEYTYIYLQILQVLADSGGVFLILAMVSLLFGRREGILAALLFAVYIPEARLVITATRDAWMPVLYLLIAYFVVRCWKYERPVDFLMLGLLTAVAAYFRSEVLLLTPWFGMYLVFVGKKLRMVLPRIALTIIPIILLLFPWTLRNYRVFDRLIPTNSGLWLAMWQSFGEYENPFGAVNNDAVTLQQMREAGHMETYETPEYDDLFRPKVLRVITHRPLWVGWTIVRRIARIPFQMHAWGIPATDDIHQRGSEYPTGTVDVASYVHMLVSDPWRLFVHIVARLTNLFLYVSAVWWFWVNRKSDWKGGVILLSLPAYNILVHAFIGVHARYILPTNPILLVFASVMLARWLKLSGRDLDSPVTVPTGSP